MSQKEYNVNIEEWCKNDLKIPALMAELHAFSITSHLSVELC